MIRSEVRNMKRILLVLCVVVMLLAACGDTTEVADTPPPTDVPAADVQETEPEPVDVVEEEEPEPAQVQDQVTVRFVLFDWDRPTYEGKIATFEEENPDVKIQIVSANEVLGLEGLTNLDFPEDTPRLLAFAADVGTIGMGRDEVKEGLVRDLTPLMEADANFELDDFFPNTLERHQWDGGTWALPSAVNYQLIFFNKDAFDEAGLPYPEPGWTWDDLLTNAQALTAREGDDVSLWGFVPQGSSNRMLVESRAGYVVDDSTDPATPRFEEAEVVDAVRWYTDLFLKEQVAPYFEPQEETEALAMPEEQVLIDKGQAAMWPETDIVLWWRNQQGNVGAVPFPVDQDGDQTTPSSTQSLWLSSGTNQPDAAWRFMDYLSRQPLTTFGLDVDSMPARRSVAEATGYWDEIDGDLAETMRYALDHSYILRGAAGQGAFDDAMLAILGGEQSVDDALAEAQVEAEAEIQEVMVADAEATPAPTVVVAPPDEEEPAAEGATTITFIPGLGSFNLEPYRDLADRFEEEHPDVDVEVKMMDLTGGTAPDLAGMAGAADCFQWFPGFQDATNREAILSLEPFLDADTAFTTDDYYAQILDQFDYQGQLMGLPADVTPYIIEYNKDVFDAAGVDYPTTDWTTDDFVETAVALTQGEDEAKQYGFVAEVYELNDLVFMSERLGATLVDDSVDPPALSFNDPATVEAIRWYADLTTEHGVKPVFLTDLSNMAGASAAYVEREGLINDGQAAMWTSTAATAALFGDREGLNLGAAPLPAGSTSTGGGYSTASGYFISADTENVQACWQWITFLTGQPSATQGLPARRSVAESNEYREQIGAERADAYPGQRG